MRRFLILVFGSALLAGCAGAALAQGPGGRPGRGGGMMMGRGGPDMLRIPEVQKELNLTPEEISKLEAAQDQVRGDQRAVMEKTGGGAPTPEQRAALRDIQEKALAGILDPAQMVRYHQLELQQQGSAAFDRPDVASALGLTAEQQAQVAAVLKQAGESRRAGAPAGGFQDLSPEERAAMRSKMEEARKATDEKLMALLTDGQKAKWKDLLGAPFTFPRPAGGRLGGRRGGGEGGGS